jgi:hypothetical protein
VAATSRRHTRSMTADAARKAVFDTPELLENITSFLPPRDIFAKAQRLSRQWKTAVDSSPAIKTRLWLLSQDQTPIQPVSFTDGDTFPEAPLWGQVTMPIYPRTVSFNPLCIDGMVGSVWMSMTGPWAFTTATADGTYLHPGVIHLDSHKNRDRQERLVREPRSSWRDMYLTDPPITTGILSLFELGYVRDGHYILDHVPLAIRHHDGLTLGLLHDTIMAGLPSDTRREMAARPVRLGMFYSAFR